MSQLNSEFALKYLGPISYFLGIAVTRHLGDIFLSQHNPISTPVDTKAKHNGLSGNPYQNSLAGALEYLTFTVPDITYVVQQVYQFMHDPCTQHMTALKRIIRYIKSTIHHGLHNSPSIVDTLTTYTDVDWGRFPDTRRSTSRYCVYLGNNLISWYEKRTQVLSCYRLK